MEYLRFEFDTINKTDRPLGDKLSLIFKFCLFVLKGLRGWYSQRTYLDPQNLFENTAHKCALVTPFLGRQRQEEPGAAWPASPS